MKRNVKVSTIARIASLLVALINECLVLFGQGVLPFTENMAYQVVSFIAVIVTAGINAWYNNDVTKIALLCGGVFDALSDGKITEEEIEKILSDSEDPGKVTVQKKNNFIVGFLNNVIKSLKGKTNKE
jgi:SPP1 family holin